VEHLVGLVDFLFYLLHTITMHITRNMPSKLHLFRTVNLFSRQF